MSGNPLWDIEAPKGFAGERLVSDVLGVAGDKIEVKTKSNPDDAFFIEVECRYGTEWRPSGIMVTKAVYWALVVAKTGVIVLVPTWRVTSAVWQARQHLAIKPGAPNGDHPTRGYLIPYKWFAVVPPLSDAELLILDPVLF